MHATLSVAEIRCDLCLTQLPPRVGENSVLARIRAAENGWTTVSYGRSRIPIARCTERGKWRIHAPQIGEFCPACQPLSTEAWVRLCQERLLNFNPPYQDWRRNASGKFKLIDYTPPEQKPSAAQSRQLTVEEANRLFMCGKCTWTCLLAMEETCTCRCGGPYHGAAVEALAALRTTLTVPPSA